MKNESETSKSLRNFVLAIMFMIAISNVTYTLGERRTVVMCIEKPAQCKIIYDYLKMGDNK
jgi:hypothetical protein